MTDKEAKPIALAEKLHIKIMTQEESNNEGQRSGTSRTEDSVRKCVRSGEAR